jgi:endonuclease/exonuclease/phosphatase family metal-dependent hydrolase
MEVETTLARRIHARTVDAVALKVATWNIHGAIGVDGRYAPQRIVDVLHEIDADIVALQEVASAQAHE